VYCGKHFAILYHDVGFDKKIVERKQEEKNGMNLISKS